VKQHVLGSLLFTLLLLLLPTTSVFYIFFSILNSSISLICILIEVIISVIHATPCIKIFLWLVRRRRFPSGIWFEIVSRRSNEIDSPGICCPDKVDSPSENLQQNQSGEKSSILVSFIHSNFSSIGEVVLPHYRNVFSGVSGSFVAKSIHGVLTGNGCVFFLYAVFFSLLCHFMVPEIRT
jgi:phosphatidylinositol glycan class Q protein